LVSAVPFGGLIPTKLHSPRARPDLVARGPLVEKLERGLWKKLTLISAAAGSGKTTLVTQWMRDTTTAVGWLSLDEADNETHRFLTYLIAALRNVQPGIGDGVEALLHTPGPIDWQHLLTGLVIIPLARDSEQRVLVLDDYHVLENPEIHTITAWLLDHLPPSLHLLLLTRQDPPLPLARLRVRDELSEFRAEDLRFSGAEAEELYNRIMRLGLSAEDVVRLEERTEGWAAAIQLSALSLRDQTDKHAFVEALQGDQRPFADYLVQEVLDHQPPEVKDFLLKTSVLRRMCGPLCSALLGRDDGQPMLERLERTNLFMVPLDNRNEWYRYHHLFAELLRRRRDEELPDEAPALHRRASEWYAEQGLAYEAVDHARRSGEQDWLVSLVERWGELMFMRSELETLHRWLEAIPEAVRRTRPWLAVYDAWCTLPGAGIDPTEAALGWAEQALEAGPELAPNERTRLSAHILVIRSFVASRRGDPAWGIELARKALESSPPDALLLRSIVNISLGSNLLSLSDYDQAMPCLKEARMAACQCGNFYTAATSLCAQSFIHRIQGRLRETERICREAMEIVRREGFARSAADGHIRLEMAWLHFERYQLAEALAELSYCLSECIVAIDLSFLIPAHALLVRVQLALGDRAGVDRALARADALPPRAEWNAEAMAELSGARALAALVGDDLDECRRWLGDYALADLRATASQHALNMVRVRLAVCEGYDVEKALQRQIAQAEAEGRFGHSMEWRVMKAVALKARGPAVALKARGRAKQAVVELEHAVVELEHAVVLAKPEGFLRVFAEQWPALAPLRGQLRSPEMRDYLAVLDGVRSVAPPRAAAAAPPPVTAAVELDEPLSARELDVLELAARGLSNQAIADKLFVSVGTVKTHMHNILSKFAVRNRTEAVHRARALGLILDG
jgi:LuxR family maltose regulon positive regulatory protein